MVLCTGGKPREISGKILSSRCEVVLEAGSIQKFRVFYYPFSNATLLSILLPAKRIFDQATKSMVKIYDHCGKDFDVFLEDVRHKINEFNL